MSETEYKAAVPTEEDVRAARFFLQVQDEARRLAIPEGLHLRQKYNGNIAHVNHYKRGRVMLIRYTLVLSPVFSVEDKEAEAFHKRIYGASVSGPLIRFKKRNMFGERSARFAGLVLKQTGLNLEVEDRSLKPGMTDRERKTVASIYRAAKFDAAVPSQAAQVMENYLKNYRLDHTLSSGVFQFDLMVDYRGHVRKMAGRIWEGSEDGLYGGVDFFDNHEIYLLRNGHGSVIYEKQDA